MSTPTTSPTTSTTSRRKYERKRASASEAVVAEEEPKMKKNKTDQLASPRNRIWNDEEELSLLMGFVGYRAETGLQPNSDWDAFIRFLGDSDYMAAAKYSKEQIRRKIRSFKEKFFTRMEKINQGEEEPIISDAFRYSNMIWGGNDSEIANQRVNLNQEETAEEEDEQVDAANVQPLNAVFVNQEDEHIEDVQVAAANVQTLNVVLVNQEEEHTEDEQVAAVNVQPLNVDLVNQEEEHTEDEQVVAAANVQPLNEENVGARTEFDSDNDAADESNTVRDAFVTLVPQSLSESKKKWQLRNLTNLGAGKRRDISQEWEALSAEKVQMEMKKLRFLARLVEAATANGE
ncbi:unnamed protein product [Microthlaspi erraticum]|uniref:Glabrous enhancer-binding protein-like DBD domain-containing protein n=1 Tax=Microthlaspi erraticum TaxID=1685480 RepID=A0A6D2KFW8_9BRAS|nr:unnamed protein product [Microthlaspi erraticum]